MQFALDFVAACEAGVAAAAATDGKQDNSSSSSTSATSGTGNEEQKQKRRGAAGVQVTFAGATVNATEVVARMQEMRALARVIESVPKGEKFKIKLRVIPVRWPKEHYAVWGST